MRKLFLVGLPTIGLAIFSTNPKFGSYFNYFWGNLFGFSLLIAFVWPCFSEFKQVKIAAIRFAQIILNDQHPWTIWLKKQHLIPNAIGLVLGIVGGLSLLTFVALENNSVRALVCADIFFILIVSNRLQPKKIGSIGRKEDSGFMPFLKEEAAVFLGVTAVTILNVSVMLFLYTFLSFTSDPQAILLVDVQPGRLDPQLLENIGTSIHFPSDIIEKLFRTIKAIDLTFDNLIRKNIDIDKIYRFYKLTFRAPVFPFIALTMYCRYWIRKDSIDFV